MMLGERTLNPPHAESAYNAERSQWNEFPVTDVKSDRCFPLNIQNIGDQPGMFLRPV